MNTLDTKPVCSIEKEQIPLLHFPIQEVLKDPDRIKERNAELSRAQSLGNLERVKVRIIFEDDRNRKMVETTVWGLTDKMVILKGGAGIPVHRIVSIS
jgi:hypothetical protein